MRPMSLMTLVLCLACGEVPADGANAFDPSVPEGQQAKSRLAGEVVLLPAQLGTSALLDAVSIEAFRDDETKVGETSADENGAFQLENIPASATRVVARLDGFGTAEEALRLDIGEAREGIRLELVHHSDTNEGVLLEGHVFEGMDEVPAEVEVGVSREADGVLLWRDIPDGAGGFRFVVARDETYFVRHLSARHEPASVGPLKWDGSRFLDGDRAAPVLHVKEKKPNTKVTVNLRVKPDFVPRACARVTLFSLEADHQVSKMACATRSDGESAMPLVEQGLPVGEYILEVSEPGFEYVFEFIKVEPLEGDLAASDGTLVEVALKLEVLREANLDLVDVVIDACDLRGIDLRRGGLRGAVFTGNFVDGRDCENAADLEESQLGPLDLSGADLSNSRFHIDGGSDVTLGAETAMRGEGVKLTGADLSGVELFGLTFTGADLRGAKLDGAQLDGCTFDRVDLRGASFVGAFLEVASFYRAVRRHPEGHPWQQAEDADFDNGHGVPEGGYPRFACERCLQEEPNENDTLLAGADFSRAKLFGADFAGLCLSEARFTNANFEASDLRLACLGGSTLAGARLTRVRADGASFRQADLSGAVLDRVSARGADMREVFAPGITLAETDLRPRLPYLDDDPCDPLPEEQASPEACDSAQRPAECGCFSDLQLAALTGANFSHVRLDHARLRGANLLGALLGPSPEAPAEQPELCDITAWDDCGRACLAMEDNCGGCTIDPRACEADSAETNMARCLLALVQEHGESPCEGHPAYDACHDWAVGGMGEGEPPHELASKGCSWAEVTAGSCNSDFVLPPECRARTSLFEADLQRALLGAATLYAVEADGASFVDADLSGADLSDSDLSGADLRRATARRADFVSCRLDSADLSRIEAERADFSGASLQGARLDGAQLRNAVLEGSKLHATATETAVDLSGASLGLADLTGAQLPGANLSSADLTGAQLIDVDLHHANLTRARLLGTRIAAVDRDSVDLREIEGVGLIATGAALQDVLFDGARLHAADFTDLSPFERVSFRGADLLEADFSGVFGDAIDFSGAMLQHGRLRGAQFHGTFDSTCFYQATLDEAEFAGSGRGACFQEARVEDADLSCVLVEGAPEVGLHPDCFCDLIDGPLFNAKVDGASFCEGEWDAVGMDAEGDPNLEACVCGAGGAELCFDGICGEACCPEE